MGEMNGVAGERDGACDGAVERDEDEVGVDDVVP